ncbi:MAG TPA: ATP-binding protein [Alphaproteobacteria bacterium]
MGSLRMGSGIRLGWAPWAGALQPSLRLKLLLPVIGGAALLIAIIGFIFISTYNDFVSRNRAEAAERVNAVRNGFLDKLQQADNIAQLIAKMPDLEDALGARAQGVVAQIVEPYTRFTELNFLTVYDRDLHVVARGDAPGRFGSADELHPWLSAAVGPPSGRRHAAVLPYEGRLLLLGAEPIRTINPRLGGFAVAGFIVDNRLLAGIKQRTGADIIVAYDGRPIIATVDSPRLQAMGTSITPVGLDASIEGASRMGLSVALDEAPQRTAFWRRLATVIAILAMTSIVVVGGALVLTLRHVTRPLTEITASMSDVAEGGAPAQIPHQQRPDEIGKMARALEVFRRTMVETVALTAAHERARIAKENAEAAARVHAAASEQLQRVFDASPVPLVLARLDTDRIVRANRAAMETLGIAGPDLPAISLLGFFVDPAARAHLFARRVGTRRIDRYDAQIRTRDGTILCCSIAGEDIAADQVPATLLGLYDITDRKRGEDALRIAKDEAERALQELRHTQRNLIQAEKMASLGQLTAGVAHEIKNPLNFIINFSDISVLLLEDLKRLMEPATEDADGTRQEKLVKLTATLATNLGKIAGHGRRADNIVKSMLLHSRGDSGQFATVEVNTLVDESLNLAFHGARALNAGFNVTLDRDFDAEAGKVDIVPQEITRVLVNLLNNAFYATEQRRRTAGDGYRPTVRVVTRRAGGQIELRVRDNGGGIPPEIVDKIFNPFFTTKPAGEGTGLGLSLSYEIVVHRHRGTMAVTSEPGEFTEFSIGLPIARAMTVGMRSAQVAQ